MSHLFTFASQFVQAMLLMAFMAKNSELAIDEKYFNLNKMRILCKKNFK